MRVVVGRQEHAASGDESVNELKRRLGSVYLFAKKRRWVTSRAVLAGAAAISRADLQATLVNLNAPRTLTEDEYSLEALVALNLDGEHDVWVPLGQTMPPHVSVQPRFYKKTTTAAQLDPHRLLSDYFPLVDDTVYGVELADLPNSGVYLTAVDPGARPQANESTALVRAVQFSLPSKSNYPVPLARAFTTLHTCEQVVVIRLNAPDPLYRVSEQVDFETALPPNDGSLTCVWRRASLVCDFRVDGGVDISYIPTRACPLALCVERIRARLNPFIDRLNYCIERGDTYSRFIEIDKSVNCEVDFDGSATTRNAARFKARPAVQDPETVFDCIRSPEGGYAVVRLPADPIAFIGDSAVYPAPATTFTAAISKAAGVDFRRMLERMDARCFNTYPHARDKFATQPVHPLLQSCPRDNFVRHLRSDPDHTYLWDMVCRPGLFPDGFNLVVFAGEADVVLRRGCPFNRARKTIVLWLRNGLYSVLRTPNSATFAYSDYEFLKKIDELKVPLKRVPLTAAALVQNLERANYEFQSRVHHRGKTVGVIAVWAGRACMLPCFPGDDGNLPAVDASSAPLLSYKDAVAFLERAGRELRAPFCPAKWVQGPGGACVGLLTEGGQFVPCKSAPDPPLPAVTAQELKYGLDDREAALYLAFRGAGLNAVEWVDALPAELQTYPRYVNRKLLVPKGLQAKFSSWLADQPRTVFLKGVEHAVRENELLY